MEGEEERVKEIIGRSGKSLQLPPIDKSKVVCMLQVGGKLFSLGIKLEEKDEINARNIDALFDSGMTTALKELGILDLWFRDRG